MFYLQNGFTVIALPTRSATFPTSKFPGSKFQYFPKRLCIYSKAQRLLSLARLDLYAQVVVDLSIVTVMSIVYTFASHLFQTMSLLFIVREKKIKHKNPIKI